MPPILVSILFGTTPGWMFWANGEIEMDLDKRAISQLKERPSAQALCTSPSSTATCDEEFLQDLMPWMAATEEKAILKALESPKPTISKRELLANIWLYCGEQVTVDFLAEPFCINLKAESKGGLRELIKALILHGQDYC